MIKGKESTGWNGIKRGWILVLCGVCLTGCLRSGTDSTAPQTTVGSQATESEDNVVTLDWYINFSWYDTPWGGNLVSDRITEETGVSVQFQTPKGNTEEKFNALIASGDLPDIITLGWWEIQVDEMIDLGLVYPLNELADEYDAYFWEVADSEVVSWYTREDGNLYCYPNSSYSATDFEENDNIGSNQTFLVRKDIYEAIGSPDMSTPEGFIGAVEMAAQMFPEIDGYPLIPVGSHTFDTGGCVSFDLYLQNFLAIPYEVDGAFYDRYNDEEYIRWLKAFRQLGAAGYLKQDIFIDQRAQMEEKLSRGQYFCMIFQRTDMTSQQGELYVNDSDSIYIAVDGPKNLAGDDPVLPAGGINGWTVTLISKNCAYPDKAIALFSYLMSEEGQMLTYLGVEGVTYDMVDGTPVVKEEIKTLMSDDREQYDALYGADNTYWMFQDNAMQLQWKQILSPAVEQLETWTYPYSQYLPQYEISFEAGSQVGTIESNITKLWGQTLPRLLLASTEAEFDEIWEDFLAQRENLGYALLKEASTKAIQENKYKLGMEEWKKYGTGLAD